MSNGNAGWTTRFVHKKRHMPMHVNYFKSDASLKKYRVCKKVNGEVITFGYFNLVREAAVCAEFVTEMLK